MSRLLINNGFFVTMDEEQPKFQGWMAIEGSRIDSLGEGNAAGGGA